MPAALLALLLVGCTSPAVQHPRCVTLLPYTGGPVVAPGREHSGSVYKAQIVTRCTQARTDVVTA